MWLYEKEVSLLKLMCQSLYTYTSQDYYQVSQVPSSVPCMVIICLPIRQPTIAWSTGRPSFLHPSCKAGNHFIDLIFGLIVPSEAFIMTSVMLLPSLILRLLDRNSIMRRYLKSLQCWLTLRELPRASMSSWKREYIYIYTMTLL